MKPDRRRRPGIAIAAAISAIALLPAGRLDAAIPASERTALLQLYSSTNGAAWTSSSNWNGAAGTECTWAGVQCDGAQTTVTGLFLSSNNLQGPLPATLAQLTGLVNLDLSSNLVTAPLPSLAGLSSLQLLNLNFNPINGSLPALTGLTSLVTLFAPSAQLTGSIPSLAGLTSLVTVNLVNNQLTGATPDLTGLTSLQSLQLSNNALTSMSPIAGATSLKFLSVNNNQLSGPIPSWAGLSSLVSVNLQLNQLSGPIPPFTGVPSLAALHLEGNQLSGSIPSLAGTALGDLYLNNNQLSGPIPPLAGLNLYDVFLSHNQLSGSIPSLTGLTTLHIFDVSQNQLTGSIPSLAGLSNLYALSAYSNQLSGSIPSLAGLGNLNIVSVSGNQLSGFIPSLSGLAALQTFDASTNQLTGPLPPLPPSIVDVNLSTNQLSGAIPSLAGLVQLSTLDLHANQLTGSIPSLAGLSALSNLSLASNLLSGPIPPLSGLAGLGFLNLSNNQLTGSIPPLTGLPILNTVLLYQNLLTGPIPSLSALTALSQLDVHQNALSGPLPSLSGLTNLAFLDASSNQLTGGVPDVTGLPVLNFLSLGRNGLSGVIPPTIGSAPLSFLLLNGNALAGPLPASMINLASLCVGCLNLQFNGLYTTDPVLAAFLSSRQTGGNWQSKQTVAPTNVAAPNATSSSVTLSWTVIPYLSDPGYYQVHYATVSGGPYQPFPATTPSKAATGLTVTGLNPSTTYYFVVRTTTPPNANNANAVVSGPSAEVSKMTGAAPITLSAVAFATFPSSPTVGVPVVPPVSVQLKDTQGNDIAQSSVPVTLALLSGTGALTGTPLTIVTGATGRATFTGLTFTLSGPKRLAVSSVGLNGAVSPTFSVSCPTLTMTPATIPPATIGTPYSVTLAATGGTAPYAFVLAGGGLPSGLTLSSSGVLSGTAVAGGTFSLTVTVTDAFSCTGVVAYTLSSAGAPQPAATSTTLQSSAPVATAGAPVTFTATVASANPASGTPTGTVTFQDGAAVLGTSPLTAGAATLTTSTLGVGAHAVTAMYGGSSTFAPSTSAAVTQTVKTAGGCTGAQGAGTLCLQNGVFELSVAWKNQYDGGTTGTGRAVAISADSGIFTFFDPSNVELVAKVLDGRGVNGRYWVLYGALSDVEYTMTVKNTSTGAVKTYVNPPGTLASRSDITAFAARPDAEDAETIPVTGEEYGALAASYATAAEEIGDREPLAAGGCATAGPSLCLAGRFQAMVTWTNYNNGATGAGTASALTSDSGYFWFFDASNVELVVKVLDGRAVNGHFWTLYGALSDVGYVLTITDTETGVPQTYVNPPHTQASRIDLGAF